MTPAALTVVLQRLQATAELAVEYGKSANERLGHIEHRLLAIERHMGLNGSQLLDTEPAPATQPENVRPGEV